MKKILLIIISLFFIMVFACSSDPKKKDDPKDDPVVLESKKITLDVAITPGTYWSHHEDFDIEGKKIGVNLFPQVAIWATDINDKLIDIIYVTETFGKQKLSVGENDPDQTFGTYYFPNFIKYLEDAGKKLPTTNSPMPDSISSATPPRDSDPASLITTDYELPQDIVLKKSITITIEKQKKINVYVELSKMTDNAKMDGKYGLGIYNPDNWQQNPEGYFNFGEPSLIYKAEINNNKKGEYDFTLIGHGGLLPGVKDDSIFKADEGLRLHDDDDALKRIYDNQADTGLKITKKMRVIVK